MEYQNEKLIEFEEYIKNRKVAIIGLGVSNLPLIDYFHDKKSIVTVFDSREIGEIPKEIIDKVTNYAMEMSLGKSYLNKLRGFDLILRSPSCLPTVPELEEEANRGAIVTTEVELLMKMCPAEIIGVTGSDGKTTTTTLISEILKKAGYNCYVGGNIGTPLFTKLNEIMHVNRILFKNGNWYPYEEYKWLITDGYADYESYKEEKYKPVLKWTEKGRKWIIDNYKDWIEKYNSVSKK